MTLLNIDVRVYQINRYLSTLYERDIYNGHYPPPPFLNNRKCHPYPTSKLGDQNGGKIDC